MLPLTESTVGQMEYQDSRGGGGYCEKEPNKNITGLLA